MSLAREEVMPLGDRRDQARIKRRTMVLAMVTAALIALTAAAQLVGQVISLIHH